MSAGAWLWQHNAAPLVMARISGRCHMALEDKKLLRPGLLQEYIAAELAGTFHLLSRRTSQTFITSIFPEPQ